MAELTLDDAKRTLASNFAPWVRDLGIEFEEIRTGYARVRVPFSDRLTRVDGILSGQAMMAIADTAMVFCVASALGGYRKMATVNQNTSFLRPIGNADTICEVRVIKTGRSLVFGEATLFAAGDDARPAAHATLTYALAPDA